VCQLLDIIILCPKIYLDYFWCIKYLYIYIYRKRKKEKEKEKRILQLAGPGGISAQPSAGARGRVDRRPTWPVSGGTARAHVPEGGGLTVLGGG
jgi:hypothetical protein